MKKLKLNHLKRSSLQESKLQELNQLSNFEKQKVFGGEIAHKGGASGCTRCADDRCDGEYDN